MSKVRVAAFGVSLDGYAAGRSQSLENPLGVRGPELMKWFFPTQTFQSMHGDASANGTTGVDNNFAMRSFENVGAWILGRNMFGPVRGPWVKIDPRPGLPDTATSPEPLPNYEWKGWWGENPPYHVPVFVLTHHARPPLEMQGGTTFFFVTDGIESALKQARAAAAGKDVRIGGGVATVRQYLKLGVVDEIHLAVAPVVLGAGENLFQGINLAEMGFAVTSYTPTPEAAHVILEKIKHTEKQNVK